MPNLQTPLDLFGYLIDPRDEDEPLHEYKERLETVAGAMLDRDLTPEEDDRTWRELREDELSGRVGEEVQLISGADDPELIEKAEETLLTYDNVEGRDGPFRWPRLQPQGERPRYGYAEVGEDGVASPESLALSAAGAGSLIAAAPGYVQVQGQLYYVPGEVKTISFHLPPGTRETVLVPWQIRAGHAHRIEVVSEEAVRLVGADGHEHEITVRHDGPQQTDYDPNGGEPQHTHSIDVVQTSGPVFAQTRPYTPGTAEEPITATGLQTTASDQVALQPGRPFPVPHLRAQVAETDPDDTGHVHQARVSPHDYWAGNFVLPGRNHSHRVEDWVVSTEDGHTHTIAQPSVPDERSLVPRMTAYEGDSLLPHSESPYALNLKMEKGWTKAVCGGELSTQLLLGFEQGGRSGVPVREGRLVGLGPKTPAARILAETVQARFGYDIILKVRLEDAFTGGVAGEEVTASWTRGGHDRSVTSATDENGEVVFELPTDLNTDDLTYEFTLTGPNGTETVHVVRLKTLGEPGGYGLDYGLDYGS